MHPWNRGRLGQVPSMWYFTLAQAYQKSQLTVHSRHVTHSVNTLVIVFLLPDNWRQSNRATPGASVSSAWNTSHGKHPENSSVVPLFVTVLLAVTGSAHGPSALTDKLPVLPGKWREWAFLCKTRADLKRSCSAQQSSSGFVTLHHLRTKLPRQSLWLRHEGNRRSTDLFSVVTTDRPREWPEIVWGEV